MTIEDSAELQLKYAQNLVSLETRNANMEGCRTISVRDLIRSSLRMRPDRIIVGEVRGAEICELLTAYNSGHAGSISVNFKICFSYVTKISGGNDTINGIFLFVKESFPICNRKIPMVRRGE